MLISKETAKESRLLSRFERRATYPSSLSPDALTATPSPASTTWYREPRCCRSRFGVIALPTPWRRSRPSVCGEPLVRRMRPCSRERPQAREVLAVRRTAYTRLSLRRTCCAETNRRWTGPPWLCDPDRGPNGETHRESLAYPAAITSSNNASTAAWPLVSLTCMSVALPCSGRIALTPRPIASRRSVFIWAAIISAPRPQRFTAPSDIGQCHLRRGQAHHNTSDSHLR